MDCITFTANGEEAELRPRLRAPAPQPDAGPLRVGGAEDRPRDGEGRGRVPALRPVRRALPDRRLGHAEIPARHGARGRPLPRQARSRNSRQCSPAWRRSDAGLRWTHASSRSTRVNDFVVKFANVNGSGSASANGLFAKAILRMGVPVVGAQHLPVEHPGPADVVRSARRRGRLARPPRRRRPDGRDESADVGQGRRRDRAGRLPVLRLDEAAAAVASSATTSP